MKTTVHFSVIYSPNSKYINLIGLYSDIMKQIEIGWPLREDRERLRTLSGCHRQGDKIKMEAERDR